jgi:uncharacterized protein
MNILITGGSGLLGSRLSELLIQKAYHVAWLSREAGEENGIKRFAWDPMNGKMDENAIHWADVIIHLAGAGVADKPWTAKRKKEILDSRIRSTDLLYNTLKKLNKSLHAFISASAIGYYGFTNSNEVLTEESPAGTDFLAQVVKKWEDVINQIPTLNIRTVIIRIGIVLSEKGGALKAMATPVKYFAGAALGNGKQQIAWIHIDDLCNMFIHTLEDAHLNGVFNGVGTNPLSNKDFTKAIGKALNKPVFLPNVPSVVMKLMLGEMAAMVLNGSAVSNYKIAGTGFDYKFETVEQALNDLLRKH